MIYECLTSNRLRQGLFIVIVPGDRLVYVHDIQINSRIFYLFSVAGDLLLLQLSEQWCPLERSLSFFLLYKSSISMDLLIRSAWWIRHKKRCFDLDLSNYLISSYDL